MGGDYSPGAQVEGAVMAVREYKVAVILVGNEEQLRFHLERLKATDLAIPVRDASEVISNEEQPSSVVRRKKDASLVVAHQMVKDGEASAVITCGNTGALLAAGLFIIGRMPGVERPALAPMLPTHDGKGFLLLDAGASAEGKPEYLVQYAIMGYLYRQLVHGIPEPRIGLINVGSEPGKGNELYRQAYSLLQKAPVNFVGNIEGRDLLAGVCDVAVCDGFTGNIVLKCLEGSGSFFTQILREEMSASSRGLVGGAIASPALKNLRKRLDYSEYGGAPLLGLNGVSFKAHGSSNARAICQALKIAFDFSESGMVSQLNLLLAEQQRSSL